MAKFKPLRKDQVFLLPPCLDDFVPEGHLARLVWEVVERLDTSAIEDKYSERGQHTYHPKTMVALLIYGYAIGIRSGRKIASACQTDTAFMYLSHMRQPDFRTINDFRKNHTEELAGYFRAVLGACRELGLGKVGAIAIDGTKLRANASAKRSKDREGLKELDERLRAEVEEILAEAARADEAEDELYGEGRGDELPAELRRKQDMIARIEEVLARTGEGEKTNLTDPDARFMLLAEGKIKPAYNAQLAVSEDHLILAAEVTEEASDRRQLKPLLEQALVNLERTHKHRGEGEEGEAAPPQAPPRVLADAGYASYENYLYLAQQGIDAYLPDQGLAAAEREETGPFGKENFRYDPQADCYVCPRGKTLPLAKEHVCEGKVRRRQRIYRGRECGTCPVRAACTRGKARTIYRDMREHLKEQMREKLQSEEGRAVYRERMHMVEAPFGHLKHNLGYRHFLLRGIEKVRGEFALMCMAYNLTRAWRFKLAAAG